MSLPFIRDGLTRPDSFNNYVLPKVFTKLVLMLSSFRAENLVVYEYGLPNIFNFTDLIAKINETLQSADF